MFHFFIANFFICLMLYKDTKAKVPSPDADSSFSTVTEVFQGNTLAPYLFIMCQDFPLGMSIVLIKENGCTLQKENKQTMSCRNYDR